MHKWLQAVYLSGCGTHPLKPQELSTILNVTFKTSVFIISRIKTAAAQSGLIASTTRHDSGHPHADRIQNRDMSNAYTVA
jgi:hypothetical protein